MSTEVLDEHITETGLTLIDMMPFMFPEYKLLHQTRKEYDDLHDQMMARFWRDNGPWALLRAMKLCNANHHTCNCPACITAKSSVRISCRLWDRLTWFMTSSGLTYCVICVCPTDSWEVGAEGPTTLTSIQNSVQANPYPPPDGFNSLTACKHMAPVSHIDVHIVFQRVGHVLGITYGSKLWRAESMSCPEIRKLDLLFARLHD
jgi:hypothetical protein